MTRSTYGETLFNTFKEAVLLVSQVRDSFRLKDKCISVEKISSIIILRLRSYKTSFAFT